MKNTELSLAQKRILAHLNSDDADEIQLKEIIRIFQNREMLMGKKVMEYRKFVHHVSDSLKESKSKLDELLNNDVVRPLEFPLNGD